jgi:hypothetical protein
MREPKLEKALRAIEEALKLLRSALRVEGAAKEGLEVLLEIAVENLRPGA